MYVIDKEGKGIEIQDAYKLTLKCGIAGEFVCSPEQAFMLSSLCEKITVRKSIDADAEKDWPTWLAGLKLNVVWDYDPSVISFKSKNGNIIGKIVNLKQPEL